MPARLKEFHYRLSWRTAGVHPGYHPSKQQGGGHNFRAFAPLLRAPDPRRIDLHQSVRDPFENFFVRVFEQRSSVQVYAVADLSASLSFTGQSRKQALLSEFCLALAHSAARTGDPFGFLGCGDGSEKPYFMPASAKRASTAELARFFESSRLAARNAGGLAEAASYLVGPKKLVFLVSDFHMPLSFIETVLQSLHRHEVVPIVIWDTGEYEALPAWGLVRLHDLETRGEAMLFMRPSLKERWREIYGARRQVLTHLFVRHGTEPFFLVDRVDEDALTQHFLKR